MLSKAKLLHQVSSSNGNSVLNEIAQMSEVAEKQQLEQQDSTIKSFINLSPAQIKEHNLGQ